ncbi:Major sperm protein [Aphelenchoides bicaudatus]|nr:Major sperm protein [Aphelenchoides bicaudatus]
MFNEIFALGLGVVGLSVAALIQCGGQKRVKYNKAQGGKSSGSSKSNKPVSSSRSKQVVGLHKPKKSLSRSSSKRSAKKSTSAALKTAEQKAKSVKDKATEKAKSVKDQAKEKAKSTKRSVQRNVNKAVEEVTGHSSKRSESQDFARDPASLKAESMLSTSRFSELVSWLSCRWNLVSFTSPSRADSSEFNCTIPSSVRLAIKVKTSDNQLYRVNPVYAYIEPGQQLNVYVMRQNGSAKLDKIVFVTVKAVDGNANLKQLFAETPYGHHQMSILPVWA